ncbi:MAG: hypothetical protein Fues2KO_09530 [Fuerstiella sp.]
MNLTFADDIAHRLSWTLVHSLWQFSLIGLLLVAALFILRGGTPRLRYLLQATALLVMLLSVVTTFLLLRQSVEDESAAVASPTVSQPIFGAHAIDFTDGPPSSEFTEASAFTTDVDLAHNVVAESETPSNDLAVVPALGEKTLVEDARASIDWFNVRTWPSSWAAWIQHRQQTILFFWICGVLLLTARPVLAWRHVRRLRRSAMALTEGTMLHRAAEICRAIGLQLDLQVAQSDKVASPTVIGWLKPVILLPPSTLCGLSAAELDAILAHELGHIARRDYLVNAAQILMETIFFYHPVVWLVSSAMRTTREECCDDIAVAATGDATRYAQALLWLEQHRSDMPVAQPALSSQGGQLLQRVRRILQRSNSQTSSSAPIAAGLLFLFLSIAVGSLSLHAGALDADNADESQSNRAAPSGDDPAVAENAPFAETVADAFADALTQENLPWLQSDHIRWIRRDLQRTLSERIQAPVAPERIEVAQEAVRRFATSLSDTSQAYQSFTANVDMLAWQLWTFADRKPLTPEQQQQRQQQRTWMENYIRNLPPTGRNVPDWTHKAQLATLAEEVFHNPLSPFFYTPMSEEEFEAFEQVLDDRQDSLGTSRLIHAPAHIFMAAVTVRQEAFRRAYPPDFPTGGLSIGGTRSFSFRAPVAPNAASHFLADGSDQQVKRYYVAELNIVIEGTGRAAQRISKPAPATSSQLSELVPNADLHYDAASGQLLPLNGARLAIVDSKHWYGVDRLSTETLRDRVRKQSIESFEIGPITHPNDHIRLDEKLADLPTGILLTKRGKLVVFRIHQQDESSCFIHFRPRPLAANLPFYEAEAAAPDSASAHQRRYFPHADTRRSTPTRSDRSVIWVHTDGHVHFVLYHDGFLQTGLNYSQYDDTQHVDQLWMFAGHMNALSGKHRNQDGKTDWKHRRRIPLEFKYAPPRTALRLDDKSFDLADGRTFVLSHDGPVRQLKLPPPPVKAAKNQSSLDQFELKVQAALRQPTSQSQSTSAVDEKAKVSGRIVLPAGVTKDIDGILQYSSTRGRNSTSGNLAFESGTFEAEVPPGKVSLAFFSEDYAPVWTQPVDIAAGEHRNNFELQLSEGFDRDVVVSTSEGLPIAGAQLYAIPEFDGRTGAPIRYLTTDEDGQTQLQHLAKTAYRIEVSATGYQPRTFKLQDWDQDPLKLTLEPAQPAIGIVLDEQGEPIADAKVRALFEANPSGPDHAFGNEGVGFFGTVLATSDAEGRFELKSLRDESRFLMLIEGPDESRIVTQAVHAGVVAERIVLPQRNDLTINIVGDLSTLRQRRGRPYVLVRQSVELRTDGSRHGSLIGADVVVEPTASGGRAVYRGLAIDPEDVDTPQSVRVQIGRVITKTVNLAAGESAEITIDLNEPNSSE